MSALAAANAGRPRKPTAAKKRAGTYKASRENPAEPQDEPVAIPAAPEAMTATEKGIWAAWARVIAPRRVVAEADLQAFERLVQIHAIVLEAQRSLYADAVDGHPQLVMEVTTKFGVSYQPRVELKIIAQYEKLLVYYFTRFGLTPADRSRASQLAAAETDDDPTAEFVQ